MSKELYKRGSFTVPTCSPGTTQEEWDAIFKPRPVIVENTSKKPNHGRVYPAGTVKKALERELTPGDELYWGIARRE